MGLAHELVHALNWLNRQQRTEVETSQAENKIRRELCEPRRTHYDSEPVPVGGGEIATDNRHDCRCGPFCHALYCLYKRIRGLFRSLFWAPPILVIEAPVSWAEARGSLDLIEEKEQEPPR